MIPLIMRLRITSPDFNLKLWIPLFLIWLLLLPLAVILIPLAMVAGVILRASGVPVPVVRFLTLIVELIASLSRTEIHVDSPREGTRVDISII